MELSSKSEYRVRGAIFKVGVAVVAVFLFTTAISFAISRNTSVSRQEPLILEIHLAGERAQFHLGEIVRVDLSYRSDRQDKVPVMVWDCPSRDIYDYHVDPPVFSDRSIELDAAMSVDVGVCGGPLQEMDLSTSPLKYQHILNSFLRPDVPGKYHLSLTSNHLRFPITSNSVDLEILSSDREWEAVELSRALFLIKSPPQNPGHEEGCDILRFLGTDAAELEMARNYVSCGSILSPAIISARNRKSVLEELEAGFVDSKVGIFPDYIRTIAFISLYVQHPDWYPNPASHSARSDGAYSAPIRGKMWSNNEAIVNEELRYANLLFQVLPQKSAGASAQSVQTLMNLEQTLGIKWTPGY